MIRINYHFFNEDQKLIFIKSYFFFINHDKLKQIITPKQQIFKIVLELRLFPNSKQSAGLVDVSHTFISVGCWSFYATQAWECIKHVMCSLIKGTETFEFFIVFHPIGNAPNIYQMDICTCFVQSSPTGFTWYC